MAYCERPAVRPGKIGGFLWTNAYTAAQKPSFTSMVPRFA
jgi:hypothetical protein